MTDEPRATERTTTTDTDKKTNSRRTGRAITVAVGTGGAFLLWAVRDLWAGADLVIRQGGTTRHLGAADVVSTAPLAGVAAWILLAALERTVRRAAFTYRIVAVAVLVLSLAGPLAGGAGLGSKLALLGMHLTVGIALIVGLPGRRHC